VTASAPLHAVDRNLVSHATHLHGAVPGAEVRRVAGATVADSGLPHDTFNVVGGAPWALDEVDAGVRGVLADVAGRGRPFSWWVPDDGRGVSEALTAAGRPASEREVAMVARAADVPEVQPPDGLRLEVVSSARGVADYAHLIASLFQPYAEPVATFYALAADALLRRSSRSRIVLATAGAMPLAGAEIHHDGATAGLYGVVTAPIARGRGFGTAVSAAAVALAGSLGAADQVVLQASADGERLYRRLGFRDVGRYAEHPID
jgi:ribosomal protein S18 acetylase RimI-like enzyme